MKIKYTVFEPGKNKTSDIRILEGIPKEGPMVFGTFYKVMMASPGIKKLTSELLDGTKILVEQIR